MTPLRGCSAWRGTSVVAAIALLSRAAAAEPASAFHVAAAIGAGSCARYDAYTGTIGGCADVGGGIRVGRAIRFDLDLDFGFTPRRTSLAPQLATITAGGGFHVLLRPMFAFQIARFFTRVGNELRATAPLSGVAPGFAGVVELGVRLGEHVELGLRASLGFEGARVGDGATSRWMGAGSTGTQLVLRAVIP